VSTTPLPSPSRPKVPTLHERASGVLLHPTSLPGPHGSGDIGPAARLFVDALAAAGQRWWQMLPVCPPGHGDSPYASSSAFAGSPLLVSLDDLAAEGLLPRGLEAPPSDPDKVDFGAATEHRMRLLRRAFDTFRGAAERGAERAHFEVFCHASRAWLADYALFAALKRAHGDVAWTSWPADVRDRKKAALDAAREALADEVAFHEFCQWQFAKQWRALREHANALGVGLVGDVPIFVAHDSADVWANPDLFLLDDTGNPTVVAGVPPDYFSVTGQRWGNPLYRWKAHEKQDYRFWVDRLGTAFERFDAIRLDHFIGFVRYWEIPAEEPTAVNGRYQVGPGRALFDAAKKALGALPLIAEDLGVLTPEVEKLRDDLEMPGIRVLEFAFGPDGTSAQFIPHNYPRRCVVYTGTHDNDTVVGWYRSPVGGGEGATPEREEAARHVAREYMATDGRAIHWDMIRLALMSVADIAIVPVQDLLGLGTEARMNLPGAPKGNWAWRLRAEALDRATLARFGHLTRLYGR
jgi:4-alpha-glucanotransferase